MNTKEAIKWLEDTKNYTIRTDYEFPKTDELIELIKRSEKFEEMWKAFSKKYGRLGLTDEIRDKPKLDLWVMMDGFKQKYFPKGVNNDEI